MVRRPKVGRILIELLGVRRVSCPSKCDDVVDGIGAGVSADVADVGRCKDAAVALLSLAPRHALVVVAHDSSALGMPCVAPVQAAASDGIA